MIRVVAFGGGHGLSASLRALRAMRDDLKLDITAVVTVADDGGSSGRLRAERGSLPPGDLRQALAALAGDEQALTAELLQHRFAGVDPLAGHTVGNLMLVGLMELLGDPVAALDHAAGLVDACGRVLPMTRTALEIEAQVLVDGEVVTVRGQHEVAVTPGDVREVRLLPVSPPACAEVLEAVGVADWLVFGPGSWFTSVIPHLLVPELRRAIVASDARRLVALNLAAEKETAGLSHADHLAALMSYMPELRVDVVLADDRAVGDPGPVERAAAALGARLVLAPVAVDEDTPRHDPAALAAALQPILGSPGARSTRGGRHDGDDSRGQG
ncbi:putative gluconeogenesis factor [Longispora fulva]|uniref:Putative gluconeogenesis factor n=1 Tax=Longispora fulva TaxID=619741 RepID=A0A8J7GMW2_9ACTN|nr:uridine diphosphate-N-acetylglucosamine-binding protein YvcK [Longispora fulva]MBG6141296.1 putative cofD-like protein [Longispora fulva]GIG59553.1 putative gluconeogenesis factor [Longispora fulva]